MRYLLDTGILVRLPHRSDPDHPAIVAALTRLYVDGHRFVAFAQNIAEFWSLCTRPSEARGGFGLSTNETAKRLELLERFVTVLPESDRAYAIWKSLVRGHEVMGKQVHDARLVANMQAHRITRVLMLNPTDFQRYELVQAWTPSQVVEAET